MERVLFVMHVVFVGLLIPTVLLYVVDDFQDYAKLVRKRDKALMSSTSGRNEVEARPIDMEMVRASSQRNGGHHIPYNPSTVEANGQYGQQLSPVGPPQNHETLAETMGGSTDLYSKTGASSAISPHDPYQVSNAAYSVSAYSSLAPARTPVHGQVGDEEPMGTWDSSAGPESRYARNFRSNTSDERGGG